MNDIIRIGTRKSALALIQTQLVADELRQVCPGIQVEIVTKDTLGDRILDKPLQEFGGKGVFVSEFEQAIQEGVIDLAVHSAKDLPMELAQGLTIAAVSGREDPRDVLVTMRGHKIQPKSMVRIGTSSPRRQLQAGLMCKTLWPGAAGTDSAATLHPILVSTTGVRSVAVKCDLCGFRAEGPECVRVCPTRALFSVNDPALDESGDTKRQQAALAQDISQFNQQACASPTTLVWLGDWPAPAREALLTALAAPFAQDPANGMARLVNSQLALASGEVLAQTAVGSLSLLQPGGVQTQIATGGGVLLERHYADVPSWLAAGDQVQTCVCVGIAPAAVAAWLRQYPDTRIDRLVVPGQALAFDWFWDGQDLLAQMSRQTRVG